MKWKGYGYGRGLIEIQSQHFALRDCRKSGKTPVI